MNLGRRAVASRAYRPAVAALAVRPAIEGATALLELVNAWALELNDPKSVEKLARRRGVDLDSFLDLRQRDLRDCDRLLSHNTLKWRTAGAFEGARWVCWRWCRSPGCPSR